MCRSSVSAGEIVIVVARDQGFRVNRNCPKLLKESVMQTLRRSFSLLSLAAALLTLASCAAGNAGLSKGAARLNAERPKDEACRTQLKKELSSFNVGIETTAGDIGTMLNRMVPKELYKGSTKTKGVTVDILRTAPITVSAADGFIFLTVPTSMSLSYGIFQTPALASNLKFKLNARVTPEWKLVAELYYLGLSDLLAEEVGIGTLSIKPRSVVDGVTQPIQASLSELISNKLNEKFPLKTQVARVWDLAQKPILLDKNYNAWLSISPQEVRLYPLYAQKNRVRVSVGLNSYAEMVVGPQPALRPPVPLPGLKLAHGVNPNFRVALNTDLFYRDIRTIAQPLLLNRELGSDGKSVRLTDLDIYGNGDRLMVKVATAGDLEGTFYLTCRPVFDPRTNVFSVEDVDFDMQTKSLLLQSAGWFLQGAIRNTIREKLTMDLTPRVAEAQNMASKAMASVKLADNLVLNGSIKKLKLNDLMVQKDKISIQVHAEGETAIVFH